MKNKQQLVSEIENIVYATVSEKIEADRIISNIEQAIHAIDLKKYKINILPNPLRLIIKHKAFNNKLTLTFKKNKFFLDEIQLTVTELSHALDCYYELDKKEEK